MSSIPVFSKHPEDGQPLFEGWNPRNCGEHRTVGAHRAWCYDCEMWCYPDMLLACEGCSLEIMRAAFVRINEETERAVIESGKAED